MRRWVSSPGAHLAGRRSICVLLLLLSHLALPSPGFYSPPTPPLTHLSHSSSLHSASPFSTQVLACRGLDTLTSEVPFLSLCLNFPRLETKPPIPSNRHRECHPGPGPGAPALGLGGVSVQHKAPSDAPRAPGGPSACQPPAWGISHSLACLISTDIPGGKNNIFLTREGAHVQGCEACVHGRVVRSQAGVSVTNSSSDTHAALLTPSSGSQNL